MNPYIAILDVGHGNTTILNDNNEVYVIDCGNKGPALLEFLLSEGIMEIDTILLSHADQDHIGGLITVMATGKFTIKRIIVNSDASKGSDLWDYLTYELSHLQEKGEVIFDVGISRGKADFSCGDITLKVVGPTSYLAAKGVGGKDKAGRIITSNSISSSFHVVYKDAVIAYLAGDIDLISLEDLIEHGVSLKAPLLVFPHHGGKAGEDVNMVAFTDLLIDETLPETVIFSIGRNKHENPRPDVVSAVRAKIKNVRIACTQLSKHCAAAIPNNAPTHLHALYAKGRAKNECCGGTFYIELGAKIEYLPDYVLHQAFIATSTQTPLCMQ